MEWITILAECSIQLAVIEYFSNQTMRIHFKIQTQKHEWLLDLNAENIDYIHCGVQHCSFMCPSLCFIKVTANDACPIDFSAYNNQFIFCMGFENRLLCLCQNVTSPYNRFMTNIHWKSLIKFDKNKRTLSSDVLKIGVEWINLTQNFIMKDEVKSIAMDHWIMLQSNEIIIEINLCILNECGTYTELL